MSKNLRFGLLVFPNITQLDMTGPLQVFSFLPGAEVHLLWKNTDAVQSDGGLSITPTTTFTVAEKSASLKVVVSFESPGSLALREYK